MKLQYSRIVRSVALLCLCVATACSPDPDAELPDAADVGVTDSGEPSDVGQPVDTRVDDTGGDSDAGPLPDTGTPDAADMVPDMSAGEVCANGMDDDGDGDVDCGDADCDGSDSCAASAVSAGWTHACAAFEDGTVRCWGDDTLGELGDEGTSTDPQSPVLVEEIDNAVDVALGRNFSCALREDGRVSCWGSNDVGQLGDDSFVDSTIPVDVVNLDDAVSLSAGEESACAVRGTDGQVVCWGGNEMGQLGNNTTDPSNEPVEVELFAVLDVVPFDDAVQVDCHMVHCCARRPDGTAGCWGRNSEGQLGGGSTAETSDVGLVVADQKNPLRVLDSVQDVTTAAAFSCFTKDDGSVWCAGEFPALPASVGGVPDIAVELELFADGVATWAGTMHACALRETGRVFCWGANGERQAGEATGGYSDGFQLVGVQDPTDFAAGAEFNCFVDDQADVFCFGRNDRRQLGADTSEDREPTPQQVLF